MDRFRGRNVIVTGARRGIGAALAERLAAEGALVLCDCDPETTDGIYDSIGLIEATGTTVMTLDGTRPFPGGIRPLEE